MTLEDFTRSMTQLVEEAHDEATILARARPLLAKLIEKDDWLPAPLARSEPGAYRQNLLYLDPQSRFSVLAFVWGEGAKTPVHDHTVWGLVGVLRGAELCGEYARDACGRVVATGSEHLMRAGDIEAVSPTVGDIHTVANALPDAPSISIHVYGADIGRVRRHWFDIATGETHEFVSGYSNA